MSIGNAKYTFKLVMLGDLGVGKSSLVNRFANEKFYENQDSTIGASFFARTISISDNSEDYAVKFEIWDTAGQERYNSILPIYYRGSSAIVIVYDITNMNSFNRAKTWVNEFQNQNQNGIIMLVCNKIDLNDHRVDIHKAKRYARDNNILFIESSAKENYNVKELFETIAKRIPKIYSLPGSNVVKLEINQKKSYCCYK